MTSQKSGNIRVFISYSHDSLQHKKSVFQLSNRLCTDGIDCNIDQYERSPAEGWPRWMNTQIDLADYVLVVCTENYEKRFKGQGEAGKGHGVKWEGAILTQELYEAEAKNEKFIPVVFSSEDVDHIPIVLKGATYYVLDTDQGYDDLYAHLTDQRRILKPGLGKVRQLPPIEEGDIQTQRRETEKKQKEEAERKQLEEQEKLAKEQGELRRKREEEKKARREKEEQEKIRRQKEEKERKYRKDEEIEIKQIKSGYEGIKYSLDEINKIVNNEFNRLSKGQITFNVAKIMKAGVSEKAQANIAKTLSQINEQVKNYCLSREIKLSPSMRVSLKGEKDNFDIQRITSEVQPILDGEVSTWEWIVKPLKSGEQNLFLSVDVLIEVPQYSIREYSLPTLEEEIVVKVNPWYYIQCHSGIIIGILTVIIAILTFIFKKS